MQTPGNLTLPWKTKPHLLLQTVEEGQDGEEEKAGREGLDEGDDDVRVETDEKDLLPAVQIAESCEQRHTQSRTDVGHSHRNLYEVVLAAHKVELRTKEQ